MRKIIIPATPRPIPPPETRLQGKLRLVTMAPRPTPLAA